MRTLFFSSALSMSLGTYSIHVPSPSAQTRFLRPVSYIESSNSHHIIPPLKLPIIIIIIRRHQGSLKVPRYLPSRTLSTRRRRHREGLVQRRK